MNPDQNNLVNPSVPTPPATPVNNPTLPTAAEPVTNPATLAAPVIPEPTTTAPAIAADGSTSANPVTQPAAPAIPVAPDLSTATASNMTTTTQPATEASSVPAAPTIDPSLLQQAIADVPKEATQNPLPDASATTLDALSSADSSSPFSNISAPSADFSTTPSDPSLTGSTEDATATDTSFAESQKSTPSVAFNDPASAPDAPAPGKEPNAPAKGNIDLSQVTDKLKKINPVILIVGGSAFVIIGLILLIALVL